MSHTAIHIAFFLSGFAGLVYQVVWVRFFGNALGNTLPSAAIVTGVFMLGLGLGSWMAGRWVDRRPSPTAPIQAYALAESLIAVAGLGLAALLPHLDVLCGAITSYSVGANGWNDVSPVTHLAIAAIAVIALLPVTAMMGATLTLLIRYVLQSRTDESGWRVGLLYGVNTAGAALGALATDAVLTPVFGLFATASLAALCNLVAALLVLRISSEHAADGEPEAPPTPAPELEPTKPGRPFVPLAVGLAGFAAMGFEMVWFRFFSVTLGGYRAVFSLLLATMLASMWLGSTAAGAIDRKLRRPIALFVVAQALVCIASLMLVLVHDVELTVIAFERFWWSGYQQTAGIARDVLILSWQLVVVVSVVSVPAFFMGFSFPVANAISQDSDQTIGRRAGGLYFANTVGAVSGAVLTGLVLIPNLGTHHTMSVLAVIGVLSVVAVLAHPRSRPVWRIGAVALVLAVGATGVFASADDVLAKVATRTFGEGEVLATSEGMYEFIAISEDERGYRRLNTNGHSMSATYPDSQRYMRLFVHFPLLHIEAPTRALVICFGVGNTVHATSLHDLEAIDVADLSRNVLNQNEWFASTNKSVLSDPRVNVFVQDGRTHLRATQPETYDLVTLEPPPLAHAGVASLYSTEFYELAKSRIKDGGFVTQWLPVNQLPPQANLALIRSFVDVFPNAILLSGALHELILVGRRGADIEIDLDTLERRIAANPALAADLEQIHARRLADFVGLFVAGSETLRYATENDRAMTDDYPVMEYAQRSAFLDHLVPASIFSPIEVTKWCTNCFKGGKPDPRVPHLDQYLTVVHSLLRSPGFRTQSTYDGKALVVPFPPGVTHESPVIADSPWLSKLFARPAQ